MGVKLHYTPNLFTHLMKRNHDPLTTVLNPQQSMDTLIEPYNRESIRNAMLKHEEIFKQQVRELHRLYRVQKMLMAELQIKEAKLQTNIEATIPATVTDRRFRSIASTMETSHSSNMSPLRKQKGLNLESPADDDKHSKGAIKIDGADSWMGPESDIELTLSIGSSSNEKESKQGIDQRSTGSGCSSNSNSVGLEGEGLKRPHWLLQALSLNRT